MWRGKGFLFGLQVTVHYLGKQGILANFFFNYSEETPWSKQFIKGNNFRE